MSHQFVHLQCHTEFSLLEGALRINDMMATCSDNGMKSVAITDNGTMFGTIEFYLAAKAKGLNPIIGCDMYFTPDITVKERARSRLLVLCKSYKGYQNLIKLVSTSHLEGFYYKPRIDLKTLKSYKEDLIVISTGNRGPVASYLQGYKETEAEKIANEFHSIFGDDFYLGVQRAGLPFEDVIIEGTQEISQKLSIPMVALNDVYYMNKEDAYLRNILFCIQTGKQYDDDGRFHFESEELYFKSADEMAALFSDIPDAIENTVRIAEKCQVNIDTEQVRLPRFSCPDNLSSEEYLENLVWKGIDAKYGERTEEIKARIAMELGIINKMHYANYFLIIYDFLFFCQKYLYFFQYF